MNAPRDIAAAPALMEAYFQDLAAILDRALIAGETYMAWFSAEASDFVRMNHGKVRQPGTVSQRYLEIELIKDKRHASHRVSLTGNLDDDREALHSIVAAQFVGEEIR